MTLFGSDSDGIKSIRLVRVARAVRLVGRFRSLRAIVDALTQSMFPVLSASVVAVMTMSIFAILGVSFFKDVAPTFFGDFGAYFIYTRVSDCLFLVRVSVLSHSTSWVCPDSFCAQTLALCVSTRTHTHRTCDVQPLHDTYT